jgi:hypothetical protein
MHNSCRVSWFNIEYRSTIRNSVRGRVVKRRHWLTQQTGKILGRISAKLGKANNATESGNGGTADAAVLKTVGSNPVRVRIPLSAPLETCNQALPVGRHRDGSRLPHNRSRRGSARQIRPLNEAWYGNRRSLVRSQRNKFSQPTVGVLPWERAGSGRPIDSMTDQFAS